MKRKNEKQISLRAILVTMLIATTVAARSDGQVITTQSEACIPPAISAQPSDLLRVSKGSTQTFTVEAAGSGTLSYQWYKSGSPAVAVGTNSNSFTMCNVARTDAGYYYVVVTNACGTVTSKAAIMTLELPPPSSTVSCLSQAVTPAIIPVALDPVDGTIPAVLAGIVDTPDPIVSNGTRTYIYSFRNRAGCVYNWSYTYTIDYSGGLVAPANTVSTVSSLEEAVDPGAPANITDACGRTVSAVLVGTSTPRSYRNSVVWTYRYTACDGTKTTDWTHTYTIDNSGGPAINTASTATSHPEAVDPASVPSEKSVCTMVIPNGFSPNGDGINDYFNVTCIEKYPDAKLQIFSATSALLYEQEHYGNLDFWGSEDAAWWNGNDRNKNKLDSDTYIYILDLDHGRKSMTKTGVVFISR